MLPMFVIPAKAGIHSTRSGRGQAFQILTSFWIPAFAGMTTNYEAIIFKGILK